MKILSIMSRFPITETIEAFRPFNFGGAVVELAPDQKLLVLDTWLHYLPSYMAAVNEGKAKAKELIAAEGETRQAEIKAILEEIQPLLEQDDYAGILMAGDFNSGSYLDRTRETQNLHNDYIVEWPVSKAMTEAGFRDSYRELHINAATDPGYTWTPRAATSSNEYGIRDRIDYIYCQGEGLVPISSLVLDQHPIMFPSDHAAVITVFRLD
jgi:exonuclease III